MTETCRNCQVDDCKNDVDNVDDDDDDDEDYDNDGKSRSAVSNGLVFIASLADPPDIEQDIRSVQ